jgi:hypothetical protein
MAASSTFKNTFPQHNFSPVQLYRIVSLRNEATFQNGGRRCRSRCQYELQPIVIKLLSPTANNVAECHALGLMYCTAQ